MWNYDHDCMYQVCIFWRALHTRTYEHKKHRGRHKGQGFLSAGAVVPLLSLQRVPWPRGCF